MATTLSYAKFNQGSMERSKYDHLPKLFKLGRTPAVVFLGTDLFHGMGTTGRWQSPNLWPSKAMMSTKRLTSINNERIARSLEPLHRVSGAFNAGCDGDSIENILYRLVGTPSQAGNDAQEEENSFIGLRDALSMRSGEVKVWVVHAGANNLHATKGLENKSILALRELLLTIFNMSSPGTLILLSGICYRADMDYEVIDQANKDLLSLVISVANHIESLDRKRVGEVQRTALNPSSHVGEADTTRLGEENLGRYDSVNTTQSANGQTQAREAAPAYYAITAKVHDDAEIAELEKEIARFDFATKSVPMKPKSRIEFLPVPAEIMDPQKHRHDHNHLDLEGYQTWMETLFPKVREMLDRAESLSSVARWGERVSYQHLPEFTPETCFGTLYRPAARYKRG